MVGQAEALAKVGAGERIRTVDNHVGNVMLYQLSYTRVRRLAIMRI